MPVPFLLAGQQERATSLQGLLFSYTPHVHVEKWPCLNFLFYRRRVATIRFIRVKVHEWRLASHQCTLATPCRKHTTSEEFSAFQPSHVSHCVMPLLQDKVKSRLPAVAYLYAVCCALNYSRGRLKCSVLLKILLVGHAENHPHSSL